MSAEERAGLDAACVAEIVRRACRDAAAAAYEDSGLSGLCEFGRWEAALGAVDSLDLRTVLEQAAARERRIL